LGDENAMREIVGIKVKLDNVINRLEELAVVVGQDHDKLIKMNGKFKMFEDWLAEYKKDLEDIRRELKSAIEDIKGLQAYVDEQKRVWFARITIWASIVGGAASVFLSELLKHIR